VTGNYLLITSKVYSRRDLLRLSPKALLSFSLVHIFWADKAVKEFNAQAEQIFNNGKCYC
jgi:hypothetical protein